MKKVAIVGVEGSGKTVLMAAMGEHFRKPRGDGLFLYAKSLKTIEYCNEQIDKLRNRGIWPDSTAPDDIINLEWNLVRRGGKGGCPEELCSISFLDFAGEVYRYAFGDAQDEEAQIKRESYQTQINTIKNHLKQAESIIVLVNLSDIINTRGVSKKASEMDWLSQRIFDFAFNKTNAKNIAVVFTQKDTYEAIIENSGGLDGVFEEYLPSVFYRYESSIKPFAVSAVNKTRPNESGVLLPDPNFETVGLEDLFSWISSVGEEKPEAEIEVAPPPRRKWLKKIVLLFIGIIALAACFVIFHFAEKENYDEPTDAKTDEAQTIGIRDDSSKEAMDAQAQYELGEKYYCGRGVTQDYKEAVKWYRKAAEQGHAKAQYELGDRYYYGWGVMEDDSEAVKWYRKAAEQGHAMAQWKLGMKCYYGLGVAKDYKEAVKWFRKSAEQGVSGAQSDLGECYDCGRGVTQDYKEAVKWYRKSAEQGNAYGQFNLGNMYEYGKGVSKDINEAIRLYRLAAANDQEDAKKALQRLNAK